MHREQRRPQLPLQFGTLIFETLLELRDLCDLLRTELIAWMEIFVTVALKGIRQKTRSLFRPRIFRSMVTTK